MKSPKPIFLEEMTWDEVKTRLAREPETVACIPLGATEQHGTHLPLGTDTMETSEITASAARKATQRGASVLVTPPLPFGATTMSMDFAGTISLHMHTLEACLNDIVGSLCHHGFRKIALFDGEGGNGPAVDSVLRHYEDRRKHLRALVVCVRWWSSNFAGDLTRKNSLTMFGHASEIETSMMLALDKRVLMEKAVGRVVEAPSRFLSYDFNAPWRPTISRGYPRLRGITDTGSTGDPSRGSKKRGQAFLTRVTDRIADALLDLYLLDLKRLDPAESESEE